MIVGFTVIIPARYGSRRLPGKPLADIGGKPLIQHVYERCLASDAERVVSRAEALAGDLQLPETDRLALVSVLLAEQERRAAALASWRRRPRTGESSSRLRSALDAIRVWKDSELSARFGLAKADRILQRHQPGAR